MDNVHLAALEAKHAGLEARIVSELQRPAPSATAVVFDSSSMNTARAGFWNRQNSRSSRSLRAPSKRSSRSRGFHPALSRRVSAWAIPFFMRIRF